MSQSYESETAASTAKSLVGALSALGAGFVFMFLALIALTTNATRTRGDDTARPVMSALQDDVLALEPSTLQLAEDGKRLKFRRSSGGGMEPVEVVYQIAGVAGEVTRESEGTSHSLAKLKGGHFGTASGLLRLNWVSASGNRKAHWALLRWGKGGKL